MLLIILPFAEQRPFGQKDRSVDPILMVALIPFPKLQDAG